MNEEVILLTLSLNSDTKWCRLASVQWKHLRLSQVAVKCSGNLLTSLQGADLCLSSRLGRYCPNTSNSQGSSEPNIRSTSKKSQALLSVKCWCSLIGGHHGANVSTCQSAWLYAYLSRETPTNQCLITCNSESCEVSDLIHEGKSQLRSRKF